MFQNTRNRSSQSSRVCPRDVNGHGRQGMDEKSIERKAKKTCWGQEAFFSSKSRPGLEKLEMGRRIAGTGQNLINVGRTYHKLMSGNRSYITTHQFHKFKYVHTFQFQFLMDIELTYHNFFLRRCCLNRSDLDWIGVARRPEGLIR